MTHHIRFSNYNDLDALQGFIHNHWRKNHPLSQNKDFFMWQYKAGHASGFVIAENSEGQIDAVLGFILPEFFQTDLPLEDIKGCRLWLAIWKVKETFEKSLLGIQLFMFLKSQIRPREISAIGINEQVAKLYRSLKFKTDFMHQGVIKNMSFTQHIICSNVPDLHFSKSDDQDNLQIRVEEKPLYNLISDCSYASRKSCDYYKKRFTNHPHYKYIFLNLYHETQPIGTLIGRVCIVENIKILRIVDLIMPKVMNISYLIHHFIQEHDYEYADIVCSHLGLIKKIGFQEVKNDMIVPHYFEPFERKTIKLQYAYKSSDNFFAIKADSDQDRPNLL